MKHNFNKLLSVEEVKAKLNERRRESNKKYMHLYLSSLTSALESGDTPDDYHVGLYSNQLAYLEFMQEAKEYLESFGQCTHCGHIGLYMDYGAGLTCMSCDEVLNHKK